MWYLLLSVLLLFISTNLVRCHDLHAPASTDSAAGCSRSLSRKVRSVFDVAILSELSTEVLQSMPSDCPLNPALDVYRNQENHKLELSSTEWKCDFCRKRFLSEHYLDLHFHRMHSDELMMNNTAVCLADLGPMVGLSAKATDNVKKMRNSNSNKRSFQSLEKCTQDEAQQIKQNCENVAKLCFRSNGAVLRKFNSSICAAIRCTGGVLKGGLVDVVEDSTGSFLWWLLRWMTVLVLVMVAITHCLFTKMIVWAPGRQSTSMYDKFSDKYFKRNKSYSWVGRVGSALADYIDLQYKRIIRFVRRLMSKKH